MFIHSLSVVIKAVFLLDKTVCSPSLLFDKAAWQLSHGKKRVTEAVQRGVLDLYANCRKVEPGTAAIHRQQCAVAQNVHHALAEDAGGQQMQGELAQIVDNGVAGVATALITNDHIVITGEQVYHAALAFVTPVNSHNGAI